MRPRFLVIGAGPSGIVTAKVLKEHEFRNEKVDVIIVDENSKLGGTYINKAYEGASLVSSKYITCFSDYREGEDVEDHPTIPQYVDYLERYATEFDIHRNIRFHTKVLSVQGSATISGSSSKNNGSTEYKQGGFYGVGSKKYKVTMMNLENGKTFIEVFDAVAVCSGLHNIPRVPRFKGQDNFTGMMFHTSQYKSPFEIIGLEETQAKPPKQLHINNSDSSLPEEKSVVNEVTEEEESPHQIDKKSQTSSNKSGGKDSIFSGKKVLVVGSGETSFDIAFDAAKNNASKIAMLTRHGFVSVPTSFPGTGLPPLDCLIMNVGTHAYESHWAAKNNFHWWLTTKIQRLGLLAMGGSSYGLNQWAGRRYNMSWDRGNKHIVNKSAKCMGLINRSVKKDASPLFKWLNKHLYAGWDKQSLGIGPEEGVKLYHPFKIVEFEEGNIVVLEHLETGERVKYEADVVALATGYVQKFPFMSSSNTATQDENGKTYKEESDSPLPSEHFILNPQEPTIAYLGFIRPNVGSIPPMAELQAMWWCTRLKHLENMYYEDSRHLSDQEKREKARQLRRRRLSGHGTTSSNGKEEEGEEGEEKGQVVHHRHDMPGPRSKPYYKLDGARLSYAVDYGTYMFALAREMEAIPSLSKWMFKNPRVFASVAFGQAHVPLFRLDGPYAHSKAEDICANELIRPILQRPYFMNAAFTANALFFASFNIVASTLSRLYRYTVEDFVEDSKDVSYDLMEQAIIIQKNCKIVYERSLVWKSKFEFIFDKVVYQPYLSKYFDHGSRGGESGGGGSKGKPQADWLALWLTSQRKSNEVSKIPDSPHRSSGGGSAASSTRSRSNPGGNNGSGGGSNSSTKGSDDDISDKLKNIAQLYKEGVLTEEEFSAAKKKLLFL